MRRSPMWAIGASRECEPATVRAAETTSGARAGKQGGKYVEVLELDQRNCGSGVRPLNDDWRPSWRIRWRHGQRHDANRGNSGAPAAARARLRESDRRED